MKEEYPGKKIHQLYFSILTQFLKETKIK